MVPWISIPKDVREPSHSPLLPPSFLTGSKSPASSYLGNVGGNVGRIQGTGPQDAMARPEDAKVRVLENARFAEDDNVLGKHDLVCG